jgi:hypothetical protein
VDIAALEAAMADVLRGLLGQRQAAGQGKTPGEGGGP